MELEAADIASTNGNGNGNSEEAVEEESAVALGARIPIPAETFLEELSQKLEVHPISVYWLLEEMRRDEGLVCPPEMKRRMEDYASVTLLRELGFRWPEQDAYEAEHGPILDPALVVPDGILPLVDCGTGTTAARQLRLRLERIERGDDGDLKARIRCRWKGDEAQVGRPGPYTPDINDGVKVNVRPYQELGLLAAPVIKKWD